MELSYYVKRSFSFLRIGLRRASVDFMNAELELRSRFAVLAT